MFYVRGCTNGWLTAKMYDSLQHCLYNEIGPFLYIFDGKKKLTNIIELAITRKKNRRPISYQAWADAIIENIDRYSLPGSNHTLQTGGRSHVEKALEK